MALVTPEQWLPVLSKRLLSRIADIEVLESYVNGNAPLPEMGRNTKKTWIAFQRKARTNFGGIACSSHANRIIALGVRVGSDEESPASAAARRIWRDNRMPMQIHSALWNMLAKRTGYLVAGVDVDGTALITSEDPDDFIAEPDPVRPWRARAAAKFWEDEEEGYDHALVWVPGMRQGFWRESKRGRSESEGDGWIPGQVDLYDGGVPVWIFDRENGQALVEPHVDVIDRINLGKLQRLCIAAIQAFRQRALKRGADSEDLPIVDANGAAIDYGDVFAPSPGGLWEIPEGFDIWESQSTDMTGILNAEKADARDFAAVTGTPVSMLQPDSANQSAGGAAATTQQQIDACRQDIGRISLAATAAMLTALRVEGVDVAGETVEVWFDDPATATLAEKMDAVSKAVAAGMSLAMAQKKFLGWSRDEIQEDEANRRRALAHQTVMALGAGAPVADPNATAVPATNAATEDAQAMKAKFDALGVAIRAGVDADAAAAQLGLAGIKFTGMVPVSLKEPGTAGAVA